MNAASNITEAISYAIQEVLNNTGFSTEAKKSFINLFYMEFNKKFDELKDK